ncbi:MAG: hypothetical protein ACOYT4_01630 [Nanoarchaeota archaeon]
MFWFFGKKKEVKELKSNIQNSFDAVKEDFGKIGQWITHLDGKHKTHDEDIIELKAIVSSLQSDVEEIKDFISFFGPQLSKQLSKHPQTGVEKQTGVEPVQTAVQTAVQTSILSNLTVMERAIVWALINSDMKLSYEDLAALLGKDKSTIRGQINAIKQKSEGLIEESTEPNGKKRVFIPDKIKALIVKNVKVRVKSSKKVKKEEKEEEIRE